MGRMRIAFAALLVAVLGAALPGRAATACALSPTAGHRYIDIDVLEQGFSPMTQQAFAGDVIRWKHRASSPQHILPYAPANVSGFPGSAIASGDVYCITFAGGSVWYRDAKSQYSVVDPVSKVCHGRCASISDRTADPAAPSITAPSAPSEQKPTLITGTSEPLTLIKIASVPEGETAYDKGTPLGQALADEAGNWSTNLFVDGGSYNLVGRAVDAAGRESVDSTSGGAPTVLLQVVQDTEPPVLTATAPTPPIITAGTMVTGSVTDNKKVTRVDVVISDLRDGQNILGDSGRSSASITQWDCPPANPCTDGFKSWKLVLRPVSRIKLTGLPTDPSSLTIPLASGIFTVRMTAYDAWGNASTLKEFQIIVVGLPQVGGV